MFHEHHRAKENNLRYTLECKQTCGIEAVIQNSQYKAESHDHAECCMPHVYQTRADSLIMRYPNLFLQALHPYSRQLRQVKELMFLQIVVATYLRARWLIAVPPEEVCLQRDVDRGP